MGRLDSQVSHAPMKQHTKSCAEPVMQACKGLTHSLPGLEQGSAYILECLIGGLEHGAAHHTGQLVRQLQAENGG